MMMNKYILLVAFVLFAPLTMAQSNTNTEDVVYLKNGGIIRGEILEIVNNETVKIQTAGRNVFVLQMNDVDRIEEEKITAGRYYKTSGYINHTGVDFLSGPGTTTVRFQMMNGYRFSPRFAAGIGAGYIPYNDPLGLIPVYLDLSYKLTEANAAPYLFLKTGYSFSVHSEERYPVEDHRGGWLLNPGMGIEFNLSGGFRWYLNAGYNLNKAHFNEEGWGNEIIENELSYRRAMFGLGFSF
ncbi:MAG: hypothetical protein WD604_17230 [Balneolaceae bacterium]